MNNTKHIAVSIIIAGGLIAGAVALNNNSPFDTHTTGTMQNSHEEAVAFRGITDDDFVYGNKDAKLTIVEFSDYECPFCARLHPTLKELVDSRPDEVNWVFRDFPVHKEAWNTSAAATCIGRLAGNESFWEASDLFFENQRGLRQSFYDEVAGRFGISAENLQSCMEEAETREIVATNHTEAQRAGGRGTPYSILIAEDGRLIPLSGALPLDTLHQVIDQTLAQ